MRLKSIKLAGFKSFVDPTTVTFPGNRCAIVGPNGCGKSNIIDAVRWVMGESSARQLRGEAATDVIFNGSSARKPTAMASIELLFDNHDGRIGGEYAAYGEIAVRRQVSRDGQSIYFLNGDRCRRRDIIDVFLGTGFGPRSYSIIEQGMISELVEAKPDDLRNHLEEAAGISKYKERRKETETRIRHARDNLDRLNDVREEIGKQLGHLERQAQAAEKYKTLFAESGKVRVELLTLRWKALGQEINEEESRVRELEIELERAVAEQRRIEASTEQQRAELVTENERFNETQGRFYRLGAEVARLDEALQARQQRLLQIATDLADVENRTQGAARDENLHREELTAQQQALVQLTPNLEAAAEEDRRFQQLSEAADGDAESARSGFEAAAAALVAHQRRIDVGASRIEHLEQLIQRLDARRVVLEEEQARHSQVDGVGELQSLDESVLSLEAELMELTAKVRQHGEELRGAQEAVNGAERAVDAARKSYQDAASEYASLLAVQQAALGRRDNDALDWIEAANLAKQHRLGETLHVDAPWQLAAETVLGASLRAVMVDDIAQHAEGLKSLARGELMLLGGATSRIGPQAQRRLRDVVQCDVDPGEVLDLVLIANDLTEALALRSQLGPGESVITQNGIWVGANWLKVVRGEHLPQGILERGQRLQTLQSQSEKAAAAVEDCLAKLADTRRQVRDVEVERSIASERLAEGNRRLAMLKSDAGVKRVRWEETQLRLQRITREHDDLVTQVQTERDQLERIGTEVKDLQLAATALIEARGIALNQRDEQVMRAAETRRQLATVRDQLHDLQMRQQAIQSRVQSATENVNRLQGLGAELLDRKQALLRSRDETQTPIAGMESERSERLSERSAVEQELTQTRTRMDNISAEIQSLDQGRQQAARQGSEVAERLTERRIAWEGLRARRGALADQVRELEAEVELVVGTLTEGATIAEWETQLARLEQRIARLGPINLAAIDEYQQLLERKTYLDAQNADLVTALQTLENAIRQIDRESRVRFKDTFDKVNQKLGEIFTKVFGGGTATLELTGEDLLETGVSLMARPPGKRNSSIHLLSGGEKALTAISLVMAIFHLNPSPVCMLDEVDAPLDDANVGRYAALIAEMSSEVQFIFVTHNKISMEMADHMMGVTMQEPGVSRLVSVDIERALAMASS